MKLDTEKVKRKMAENFLNNSTLSQKTGLTPNTVSNIVRGITEPRAKNLKKICEALNCTAAELLKDE